jgi:hypothetical protein
MDMIVEPFIASTVAAVSTKIAEEIWMRGGKFASLRYKLLKARIRRKYIHASKKYEEAYRNRHGLIKVLFMSEPVSLGSIYVETNLATEHKKEYQLQIKKEPAIHVANSKQYLMILGKPGAGKSTFLRRVGIEALKGSSGLLSGLCLPVFIELKRLSGKNLDLKEMITNEFRICGYPNPESFVEVGLVEGYFLILLDGLDEVPSKNISSVISTIEDFVDQYRKNRYIASCRTPAYTSRLKSFSDVKISKFDNKQIKSFIQNWFKSPLDEEMNTADRFWNLLKQPSNELVRKLATTPLLLTFLCLVYSRTQDLPRNRSEIYKRALAIILEEWTAEKRIEFDEPIFQGFNSSLEKVWLAEIAFLGFKNDRSSFPEDFLTQHLRNFLIDRVNAPTYVDTKKVLANIESQQGILVEISDGVYSFSHITFQEYLTTWHIHHRQMYEAIIDNCVSLERWHHIIVLLSGMMIDRAGSLINRIYQKSLVLLESEQLNLLVKNVGSISHELELKCPSPVSRKAISLIYILCQIRLYKFEDIRTQVSKLESDLYGAVNLSKKIRDTLIDLSNGGVKGLASTRQNSSILSQKLIDIEAKSKRIYENLEKEIKAIRSISESQRLTAEFARISNPQDVSLFDLSFSIGSSINNSLGKLNQEIHLYEFKILHEKIRKLRKDSSELFASKYYNNLGGAYASLHKKIQDSAKEFGEKQRGVNNFHESIYSLNLDLYRSYAHYFADLSKIPASEFKAVSHLSEAIFKNLISYLSMNILILKCKESSEGISSNSWLRFERNLITHI